MTIKEVSQALGCDEKIILNLCKNNMVQYVKVIRRTCKSYYCGNYVRDSVVYEIDPEEVEYIDWWINGGKEEYLERVGKLVNAEYLKEARIKKFAYKNKRFNIYSDYEGHFNINFDNMMDIIGMLCKKDEKINIKIEEV